MNVGPSIVSVESQDTAQQLALAECLALFCWWLVGLVGDTKLKNHVKKMDERFYFSDFQMRTDCSYLSTSLK